MMKKACLLVLLLCSTLLHSQTVELQKLSTGELIDIQVLQNREIEDIYGYLYLFKKDQLDKKEYLYEYVLLDKNLNKMTEGNFIEKLGSWSRGLGVNAIYRDGYITFKIGEMWSEMNTNLRTKYRILNIKENTLTDSFVLDRALNKQYNTENETLKKSIPFTYYPTNFGYYLYTPLLNNVEKKLAIPMGYYLHEYKHNELYFTDAQLEPTWSYKYNAKGSEKAYEYIDILNGENKSDLVIGMRSFWGTTNIKATQKGEKLTTFLFFDKTTGDVINEFTPFGIQQADNKTVKEVDNVSTFIHSNDKITFVNNIMEETTKGFYPLSDRLIGYSRVDYTIKDGQASNRHFFTWDQLSEYLPINKYGYVREEGEPNSFLHLHKAIIKLNGNLIFILEQYKPLLGNKWIAQGTGVKIDDMFFIELDQTMKVVNYKRVNKDANNKRNRYGLMGIEAANKLNAWDYSGYQELAENKYVFFYFNKQKPEDGSKKKWVLGIVTYENGVFKEEKIALKTANDSELSIMPAKKGYIMIIESFKDPNKSTEVRLEKIN